MVSLMPLRADLQAKFDSAAAQRFVAQSLGLPYGYHNFIWGFIDTPTQNFPPPLSEQFFSVAFSVFDRTSPALATRIYVSGMNKRLGTSCNNTECLVDEIMRRNTTLGEVMTVPEQDSWVYNDGPSMVCNVFVLEVLKAAGVFGTPPLRFQATEFTPRDLYTMAIFDPTYKQHLLSAGLPCPPVPADVCQITGPYVAQFPHWNSIKPYADMCERCPGMPPDYTRPDGC
jgi:hypothetical protein